MVGACQQNSGIFLVRGGGLGPGRDAGGGRGRDWDKMPTGAEAEQAGSSERPETGRDAGGGRGRDWDKMPVGAEAEQAGSSERPETGRDAGGG